MPFAPQTSWEECLVKKKKFGRRAMLFSTKESIANLFKMF